MSSALLTLMLTSTRPEAMEVRQELYGFPMTMTQDVTSATFLISDQRQLQEKPSIGLWLPLVHFELNSTVPSPAGAETILSGLQQYGITGKRPLTVTGPTCRPGTEKVNVPTTTTMLFQGPKTVLILFIEKEKNL